MSRKRATAVNTKAIAILSLLKHLLHRMLFFDPADKKKKKTKGSDER